MLLLERKLYLHAVLLRPLYELALEVDLLIGHLVYVDHLVENALLYEPHAGVVAAVEVERTHKGLEGVAAHVRVVGRRASVRQDELRYAHLLSQTVQGLTLHELGARVGEEALSLAGKMAIDDVAHGSVEHSVAQKLQALVVHGLALGVAFEQALVHERELVERDVVRVDPNDVVER